MLEDSMPTACTPRLLIADDDADLLAAYLLFFEPYGYGIRTAGNGADALSVYRAWHPHAVVLDIQMPRMDGRAVAGAIRQLRPAVASLLIAVSALSSPSELDASIRSGFDHHFVKPVNLPTLLARVAAHFQSGDVFH
jgi:CheY-like chemotaxis protein